MKPRCSRSITPILFSVLVIAIAALAFGGCGGESPASTATSAISTSATTAVVSTSATTSPPSTSAPSTSAPGTSSTSSTTAAAACSAAQLSTGLLPQLGLPPEVEVARAAIFVAATSCDYEALENFAVAGSKEFTFSFGGEDQGPAAYWRAAEQRGEPVLAALVNVLNMPYGREDGMYVWPFAHGLDFGDLTPDQEDLLPQFFIPEDIFEWKNFGGYLGYRVGIDESGEWMFFVAGD